MKLESIRKDYDSNVGSTDLLLLQQSSYTWCHYWLSVWN